MVTQTQYIIEQTVLHSARCNSNSSSNPSNKKFHCDLFNLLDTYVGIVNNVFITQQLVVLPIELLNTKKKKKNPKSK